MFALNLPNVLTLLRILLVPVLVAALVALVSLHRLAGWVAMVIIARELTVTVTRMQATQHGVVIAANGWGKAKTIVQVAAIFFLIAVGEPSPAWVDGLVYGMVAITIVSGIDYFFGLRRVLREAEARRVATAAAAPVESTVP